MLNTVQSLVTKKRVTENASSFAAPVTRGDIPQDNGSASWEMEHHGNRKTARKPGEADPGEGQQIPQAPCTQDMSHNSGSWVLQEIKAIHSTLTAPSKSWLLWQGAPVSSLEDPALGSILRSQIKILPI